MPGSDKQVVKDHGKPNITLSFQNAEHWNEAASYLGILITHYISKHKQTELWLNQYGNKVAF